MSDIDPLDPGFNPDDFDSPEQALAAERMMDTVRARIIGRGIPRRFDDFTPRKALARQATDALTAAGTGPAPVGARFLDAMQRRVLSFEMKGDAVDVRSDLDPDLARLAVDAHNDGVVRLDDLAAMSRWLDEHGYKVDTYSVTYKNTK